MSIDIREVKTKSDAKQFVNLPFGIYKGNKFWVPPLKEGEMKSLFSETNPAFDFCKAKFWLAFKNGKCLGRVGAIINETYNKKTGENMARFSRLEFMVRLVLQILIRKDYWLKVLTICRQLVRCIIGNIITSI